MSPITTTSTTTPCGSEESRYNSAINDPLYPTNLNRRQQQATNLLHDSITTNSTNGNRMSADTTNGNNLNTPNLNCSIQQDGHENGSGILSHIDPPKGFEPSTTDVDQIVTCYDATVNSSLGTGHRLASSACSSASSTSQVSESSLLRRNNHNSNNEYVSHVVNPSSGDTDNVDDLNQPRPQTQIIQAGTSAETNEAQSTSDNTIDRSNIIARTSFKQDDFLQPQASTSALNTYPRIMNGLNNIVTKISKAFVNTSISMMNTDRCLRDDMPKFAFGHRRTLEKTWKLMDKVVKCCQHHRMKLNNSPPFILEILPETYQHLKLIHTTYDSNQNYPITDSEYSQVFLKNLQNRCKLTLKLFKDAKEEMYDEKSDYRQKLTRNTLVFNHILSELRAIYPNGKFIGDKYLITKKETAGEFWRNSFGSDVLVDWKTFYHALQQVHNIDSSFFSLKALEQTIDLTCDGYISIFEFDVFTRLFQPWATLLKNWQILAVTHPGYKAFLTYDELKARLQKHIDKPGSYVFRLSCTRLGQWAIGYVTQEGQILQTIVQNISLSQALTDSKFYSYPDGKDGDPSLSLLCSGMAGDERNVTVTEEQYEIYCDVGNSFQTCKICFENDKDIRVEPCNHLLCTSCLLAWQESEGQGCPYCRTEIKETVQITMDLPRPNGNGSNHVSQNEPLGNL